MNICKEKILNFWFKVKSDYRHFICIGLTLIFAFFTFVVFYNAFPRLIESLTDVYTSGQFYVSELFNLNLHANLGVKEMSKIPFEMPFNLPNTWEEFTVLWGDYWNLVFSSDTFVAYLGSVGDFFYYLSKFLVLVLPLVMIVIVLSARAGRKTNNDYNKDTTALIRFKRFEKKVYLRCKYWCIGFIDFVKENSLYAKLWLAIWLFNFNIISIIVEFLAFYLYFVSSFDFKNIYVQVVKLLMDLSVMIDFVPVPVWVVFGAILIDMLRKKIGYSRLNHMENKDRGFINDRSICIMLCGTMGKKKTTIVTDISISQEIMFRDKAFEKILEQDLKFPFFPWINLENDLKYVIERKHVYNLATCRRYVQSKKRKFYKKPYSYYLYGYDFNRYGMTYDNGLFVADIWDVIETYAQLYFIYIIQSSLLISNYSIRVDNILEDAGNFPLWNTELFKRDSRMIDACSRHAHILDFDSLRLGKQVLENNKNADMFEFGVIDITEIGKERGNMLDTQHLKKTDLNANQKNDLFNSWLKMIRHSATVDNFPFVKVITDDQRPESLGADARDLVQIVHIDSCSDTKIAMPLFFFADLIIPPFLKKFAEKYYQYRFERGDNTLPMYLYHGFTALIHKYYVKRYNIFGYMKLDVSVEDGTGDGLLKKCNYSLMSKKVYSKRFSTDCYSDFFNEKALRSKIGLDDLPEYKTEKASFNEMLLQNAYFYMDLCNMLIKEKK